MAYKYVIGDRVVAPNIGENAVVEGAMFNPHGGLSYKIRVDEPLPYIGLPNPRRAIWAHESHIIGLDKQQQDVGL